MTYFCWAEIRPFDPITGERVSIYVTSADDRRATGRGGPTWEPAMTQPPEVSMRLFNGDFANAVTAGGARLPLQMGVLEDGGSIAKRCFWPGAPIEIRTGPADSGALPADPFFVGRVSGATRQGDILTLECSVDEEPFAKDVLTATYAGTGGVEGPAELKGRVKPLVLGHAKCVEPVLIDAVNNIYQFSGYGAIEEITTLFERASAFGSATANYATYANLVAASVPNGRWASCLNLGLIKLGAPAYGVITGDIKGHKVGSATPRLTGAVIEALAGIAGVSNNLIAGDTLDAMDAAAPYPINLVLRDQGEWYDVARRLALFVNHQAGISLTGTFFAVDPTSILRADPSAPTGLLLDAQGKADPQVISSEEERVSPPYYKTIIGANRCWRVHEASEIAFYSTITDLGAYSAGITYREGNIVSLPNGARYLYINTTPTSGNDPPNATYWAQIGGAIGEASNIIYRKVSSMPSTPAASTGVPSGWVDDIASVGGGNTPVWASFGVKNPSDSKYYWQTPFTVSEDKRLWDGLDANGNVNTGKVDTPAIVNNAVSNRGSVYTDGSISCPELVQTTIQSTTITTSGGTMFIIFGAWLSTSGPGTVNVYLYRGATLVCSLPGQFVATLTPFLCTFVFADSPSAGSYTYSLRAMFTDVDGNAFKRSIVLFELKK